MCICVYTIHIYIYIHIDIYTYIHIYTAHPTSSDIVQQHLQHSKLKLILGGYDE